MSEPACWALVPAAGSGTRMGAARPKQYLPLLGRPVLVHTLERLCTHPRLAGVQLCLAANDAYWPTLAVNLPKLLAPAIGGAERALTVLNGLRALAAHTHVDDWVLVHDAVRPCVRPGDIDVLIARAGAHAVGGLLGLPVTDTVKRADADGRVLETVARRGLWRALTPQMFRIGALTDALTRALAAGVDITDEASAMEYAGHAPLMVAGHGDNIKVTVPADLPLAELYLKQQLEADA